MIFYRFDDIKVMGSLGRARAEIDEQIFYLAKETPCGYWITDRHHSLPDLHIIDYKNCIWVSKTARKRFAYPNREQAWESFIARKRRQVKILKSQLRLAQEALDKALNNPPGEI